MCCVPGEYDKAIEALLAAAQVPLPDPDVGQDLDRLLAELARDAPRLDDLLPPPGVCLLCGQPLPEKPAGRPPPGGGYS